MNKTIHETGEEKIVISSPCYLGPTRASKFREWLSEWGEIFALWVSLLFSALLLVTLIIRSRESAELRGYEPYEPPKTIIKEVIKEVEVILISGATITAYSSEVGQTDDSPFITASGVTVYDGLIACPGKYKFGTKIKYAEKIYTCDDRMNIRYREANRFDIWFPTHAAADDFGTKRNQTIKIIL